MRGLLRAQLGPRPRLRPRLRPPTRRRPAALVPVLAALLASAGVPPCAAYLSSGGEASGGEKTSTHATIVLEALAYLGKVMPVDSELRPHLEQLAGHRSLLVRGSNDAEREGGGLSLLGAEMGRSGLAHFYNPTTGQGYRGAERVRWVQTLESMGWLDGALTQALGPALSSEGLSEWYYARAVQSQLVRGGAEEAARALGYAAHLVADATVPQHATDCGEENGDACHHDRYERFVEQNYGRYGQPRSTYWELETVARGIDTPGLLVVRASHLSAPLIEPASSGQAELMDMVAARTVALAKELTAALILRYLFDVAGRKQVEAVVLQITRARMQGALRGDGGTPADLVPVVRTVRGGGERYGAPEYRGYLANTADVQPQQGADAFGWSFVHFAEAEDFALGEVTFNLEMWDVDADYRCRDGCGNLNKPVFIDGSTGAAVNLTLSLTEESEGAVVAGHVTGCDVTATSRGACDDTARIDYVIGRSYLIEGVAKERGVVVDFSEAVSGKGLVAIWILSSLAAICASLLCFGCWKFSLRIYRRWQEPKRSYY